MSLVNRDVDLLNIIQVNKTGFTISSYYDIRKALVNKFQEIYGSDIDTSTGTVDGVYIDNIALLISNLCQAFKMFYNNLDINTATGKYLDILCALSNVHRKSATASTAVLKCTLDENEVATTITEISFLDNNGTTWSYKGSTITLEPGVSQYITVTCSKVGPITAKAGSITKLVSQTLIMSIEQEDDAAIGSYQETDSELRSRRNQTLGASGSTVLESLLNALTTYSAITDAKIYNNSSSTNMTVNDGTVIAPHDVYIILRMTNNVSIEDSTIGTLIHNKMTPGIKTTASTDTTYGENVYYEYEIGDSDNSISQDIYWKKAIPEAPEIKITINPSTYFSSYSTATLQRIAENVMEYANNLSLSSNLSLYNIQTKVMKADYKFRTMSTFDVDSITINGSATTYIHHDTYYNYTTYSYEQVGTQWVVSIK